MSLRRRSRVRPLLRSALRIVIAAKDPGVRDRLRTVLQDEGQFVVDDTAADAADAVQRTKDLNPDVLVVDLRGQEAFCSHLLKELAAAVLPRAVAPARAGEGQQGAAMNSTAANYGRRSSDRTPTLERDISLTQREVEIVSAVVAAGTNKDIARQFAITETTVKHHLSNIFDKVGVSTRLELAMFVQHHGLGNAVIASHARRARRAVWRRHAE